MVDFAEVSHLLDRINKKGVPFIGRCRNCGLEGPMNLAQKVCSMARPGDIARAMEPPTSESP